MCCDEVREKISVMIDEALSEEDRTLVTEHLAACPECMQVFEAFSALSACLGELEEPPEGLRDAVMEKVRVQARRPVWRKYLMRFAGVAACFAMILYAGSAAGLLPLGSFSGSDSAQVNAALFTSADSASAESMPMASEEQEPLYARLMEYGNATLYEDGCQEERRFSAAYCEKEAEDTAGTEGNTVAALELQDLLAWGSDAEYGSESGDPDYTVTFSDDTGISSVLLIWVEGDSLYCEDPDTETAYYAAGSADAFLSAFYQ